MWPLQIAQSVGLSEPAGDRVLVMPMVSLGKQLDAIPSYPRIIAAAMGASSELTGGPERVLAVKHLCQMIDLV